MFGRKKWVEMQQQIADTYLYYSKPLDILLSVLIIPFNLWQ
jgi:hypothetical protein